MRKSPTFSPEVIERTVRTDLLQDNLAAPRTTRDSPAAWLHR
jgi:hypothetical protein